MWLGDLPFAQLLLPRELRCPECWETTGRKQHGSASPSVRQKVIAGFLKTEAEGCSTGHIFLKETH